MDVGSKEPLQVIKFDHPESPTEHRWELIEGSEQDLLPYTEDPDRGRILRIKAKQDFCMDYHVGVLQQECKAIGFVVRSESNFAFYAEIRVRSQQGVLPDSKVLYFHVIEGSYPEQHPKYSNEYEVHVPVDRLENGWVLMKIDLLQKGREAATVRGENWEFDRLLMLRLKGSGIEIDCARIELYKESPFEPYPVHEEPSPSDTPSPAPFDHQAILTKRNCQRVMPDKPDTPPQFFVYKGKFHHLWPEAAKLLNELRIRPKLLEPEEEPIIQELEGAPIGSRAEMEGILKEFCPELLLGTRQPDKPMTIAQILPGAEQPTQAIPVSPVIRQLAALIRARREAGDRPYTLLLGSSLSLTPEVRQAVCGSDDWEAFWTTMQRFSTDECRALIVRPLAGLNLASGYHCLAKIAQAGSFNVILTANIDDALDDALRILSVSECKVLCHGQISAQEIVVALSRPTPRVKAVKLHGDINAYKLLLTPEGQFEFPKELEEAMERLLSQDTILVGDISSDTDIQRCIRKSEGALWVVVPEEPQPGSFLYNAKKACPKGEVISGPEAEFVSFFSALARELGTEGPETSTSSSEECKLIEFTFTPPEPDDQWDWLSAFRKITEEHRAGGSWTDNNDADNRINRLEDFLKPFCRGQVHGASFALYSKDADGNFYEEVRVKVKPERMLIFEVTDRTQVQKRGELVNTIQREISNLKGVQPISPTNAQAVTAPNPFGDTGRITDPDRFFGREELLRQVFEELGKGVNLSLVGESQVGKSSLLSMVCALGPERMSLPLEAFAYLSLEWVDNEDDFYEALCDALGIETCRGFKLTRALRDKRIVLCLDEIEKMAWEGFTVRLRSQLRGLADGPAAPLKLVIASRSPLVHLFPDSPELDSPPAGICRQLDVGPFPPDVARAFLAYRLRGTAVTFTEGEISVLLAETGGHPAKLQRAAADLYRRKRHHPES